MQLKDKLFVKNNKSYWTILSKEVLENNQLNELIELFLGKDRRIAQRASAIIMTIGEITPDVFGPYLTLLVDQLNHVPTETQKRNIVRILHCIKIPQELEALAMNHCFEYLSRLEESIATRAFAMKVLGNLYKKYPEIESELLSLINLNLESNPSPAIRNCGHKIYQLIAEGKRHR
jgi:hypothetical protein